MIEPTIALQEAIRAKLINSPAVTALVSADRIKAGTTRPDECPCIRIGEAHTVMHGNDYTSQRIAEIFLDVHAWTVNEGERQAKEITWAVQCALDGKLTVTGGDCFEFKITGARYPRDPDPDAYGHGVLSVEALVRWVI
jgi:hypothetical protein